jgi:hypothetical protein
MRMMVTNEPLRSKYDENMFGLFQFAYQFLGGAVSSYNNILDDFLRKSLECKGRKLKSLEKQDAERDPIVNFLMEYEFLVFVYCRLHCRKQNL